MRNVSLTKGWLGALGWTVAAFTFGACADVAPTGVRSPEPAGASLARGSLSSLVAGPTVVEGNLGGSAAAVCAELGFNYGGVKIDGAFNSTIGGNVFTISGGGRYLSFTSPAGSTPLAAVLVKGGTDAYLYAPPVAGTLMRAPLNGGGNIPQISNYVVCYGSPNVTKKIVAIYGLGPNGEMEDANGNMFVDQQAVIAAGGQSATVPIPIGQTRWILYQVTINANGANLTGVTLTDNMRPYCDLVAATLHCDSPSGSNPHPGLNGPAMTQTWGDNDGPPLVFVNGTATVQFFADVTNTGQCGSGNLDDKAYATLSNGSQLWSNLARVTVTNVCPR
jgi:hypothetical protein